MKILFKQNCIGFYNRGSLIGNNPLETFINYKLLNASRLKFDCDSSPVVKEILGILFGEGAYTDTLISPQNLFTAYVRYFHEDILTYDKKSGKLIVPNIPELKKQMIIEGIADINSKRISNAAVWSFHVLKQRITFHESMIEFLESVYSLPNFSPVCRGFNLGRVAKTADNFFIVLDKIRLFLNSKDNGASDVELKSILRSFLSEAKIGRKVYLTEEEVINEVENWLASFESYKEFVEKYHFESFLENPDDASSRPKELWVGLLDGTNLLPTKEEFISSVEFITNAIKQRGIKMHEIFKEIERDSEGFKTFPL